jgi:hypothetical protein
VTAAACPELIPSASSPYAAADPPPDPHSGARQQLSGVERLAFFGVRHRSDHSGATHAGVSFFTLFTARLTSKAFINPGS